MIEVLVTCTLLLGQVYLPPDGWTISKVDVRPPTITCEGGMCEVSEEKTTVELRREVWSGTEFVAPDRCSRIEVSKINRDTLYGLYYEGSSELLIDPNQAVIQFNDTVGRLTNPQ